MRLGRIVQRRGETAAGWQPWGGAAPERLPEGHFWATDLQEVRRELLSLGSSPKVHMSAHHRVSCLTLGKTKIHAMPEALPEN